MHFLVFWCCNYHKCYITIYLYLFCVQFKTLIKGCQVASHIVHLKDMEASRLMNVYLFICTKEKWCEQNIHFVLKSVHKMLFIMMKDFKHVVVFVLVFDHLDFGVKSGIKINFLKHMCYYTITCVVDNFLSCCATEICW